MTSFRAPLILAGLSLGLCLLPAAEAQENRRERWKKHREEREARKKANTKASKQRVHGGVLGESKERVFEVLLGDKFVRIYIYDKKGNPLSAKGAAGTASIGMIRRQEVGRKRLSHQGTSVRLHYVGTSKKKGRLRSFLEGKHSLGKVDREAARVDVIFSRLKGVKGKTEFRVTFHSASPEILYTCADVCKARFLDPGKCPKCKNELQREGKIDSPNEPRRPLRRR